jgi:hypothetical protein
MDEGADMYNHLYVRMRSLLVTSKFLVAVG